MVLLLFNKNFFIRIKQRNAKFLRKERLKLNNKSTILLKTYSFFIPHPWLCYILLDEKRYFYVVKLFHSRYYYQFSIPKDLILVLFDYESNSIFFSSYKLPNHMVSWIKTLNLIITFFTTFYFLKIKFKGKGYYIYKNRRNTIAPQFGYSHRIYVYSYFNIVRFLTKTKVLIFGFSKKDILSASYNLKSKRPINIFTGRGVRFSKQIVYKKTGKVSMYR